MFVVCWVDRSLKEKVHIHCMSGYCLIEAVPAVAVAVVVTSRCCCRCGGAAVAADTAVPAAPSLLLLLSLLLFHCCLLSAVCVLVQHEFAHKCLRRLCARHYCVVNVRNWGEGLHQGAQHSCTTHALRAKNLVQILQTCTSDPWLK